MNAEVKSSVSDSPWALVCGCISFWERATLPEEDGTGAILAEGQCFLNGGTLKLNFGAS